MFVTTVQKLTLVTRFSRNNYLRQWHNHVGACGNISLHMLLLLLGSNTIWSLVNCALRLPFSIIKVTNLLFFYFVKCHRISKIILLVQFCMQIALKILIFQANSETKNIHQKIGRKSQFKKKFMLHVYYLHFNAIIMLVACGRKR